MQYILFNVGWLDYLNLDGAVCVCVYVCVCIIVLVDRWAIVHHLIKVLNSDDSLSN